MHYGKLFLNKVINDADITQITRHNISLTDMHSDVDKETYRFITKYAEENGGDTPSYATVTANIEGFEYIPEVTDAYTYLAKEIKGHSAKQSIIELFRSGEFERKLNEMDGNEFIERWLPEVTEGIREKTAIRKSVGTNVNDSGEDFLQEYRDRKEGKSFKLWKSKFPYMNEQIGGYFSGNMYTWYGRSGRGKSVFTMTEAIEAAFQGANVLVWALEMSKFEWIARAYSMISAIVSGSVEKIDGVDYEVGFENRALLTGKLDEGYERGLEVFVQQLAAGTILPGTITLRAADDEDFIRRDVNTVESDILATKADVVLIDPIYLMDYERNTSRVAGGDVANTSKMLRRLAGVTKTAIHVVTQAEEVKDDTDEEGVREIRPPARAEIKKTKSVLEDAANTFGIDSINGEGIIEIGKGRNGGEGSQINVLYLPNYGIVRQMETGEAAAADFEF